MQEALSSLKKELIDQKEAHRKELATLQQQLVDLQKGSATYQPRPPLHLEEVDESQVGGHVSKKAIIDQGGQSIIVRISSMAEDRGGQPKLILGVDADQRK